MDIIIIIITNKNSESSGENKDWRIYGHYEVKNLIQNRIAIENSSGQVETIIIIL